LTAEFAETGRRERRGEHACEAVDRSLLLHFFLPQGEKRAVELVAVPVFELCAGALRI
jgi:hypothetical protein